MAFTPLRSLYGDLTHNLEYFLSSNGVTVSLNSMVKIAAGYCEKADAAGDDPIGVTSQKVVGNAVLEVPVYTDPFILYYNQGEGAYTQASVGKFFDLNTPLQADEDVSLTTTGQLVLVHWNPFGDGTDYAVFKIAQHGFISRNSN